MDQKAVSYIRVLIAHPDDEQLAEMNQDVIDMHGFDLRDLAGNGGPKEALA